MSTPGNAAALKERWAKLSAQERTGITIAALLVGVLTVWLGFIGPSLQTWRTADAKTRALNSQLQQMQSLQAQARQLQAQAQPGLAQADALLTLKQTTQQVLGMSAQIHVVNDRATVTLKDATPEALAQWLAQARLNARSVPLEARLNRAASAEPPRWNGTLTMSLPAP
jgi:general secretion pathway protein M